MISGMLGQSKKTIALSVGAAIILISSLAIAGAIWFGNGFKLHIVSAHSDIIKEDIDLPDSDNTLYQANAIHNHTTHKADSSPIPDGEIWNETELTIYATPDVDICINSNLTNIGEMYWQTSNPDIISGFYNSARTKLGYDNKLCRYPIIKGTGTTTITAGTYDGRRKDSIKVNVVNPPVKQWKHEVLTLVNNIRAEHNLAPLTWGNTCEEGANTRANEIVNYYNHTRPNGSSWSTACPIPSAGGNSGENLAVGNSAVSPDTVVALWMSSPSHRENILNPDFTKLSVGFVFDLNTNYKTHWSQFFSDY